MLCSTLCSAWVLFSLVQYIVPTPEIVPSGHFFEHELALHISVKVNLCCIWGCEWSGWPWNSVLFLVLNFWPDISAFLVLVSHIPRNMIVSCHLLIVLFVVATVYNLYFQICAYAFKFWFVWDFLRWLMGSAFLASSFLIF